MAKTIYDDLMANGRSENTIRIYVTGIEYWHAALYGKKPCYPKPHPHVRREVKVTPAEAHSLIYNSPDLKIKAIFAILWYGGLRRKEVCNLNLADVDTKNMRIQIRDNKDEDMQFGGIKSHRERVVAMHKELQGILQQYVH